MRQARRSPIRFATYLAAVALAVPFLLLLSVLVLPFFPFISDGVLVPVSDLPVPVSVLLVPVSVLAVPVSILLVPVSDLLVPVSDLRELGSVLPPGLSILVAGPVSVVFLVVFGQPAIEPKPTTKAQPITTKPINLFTAEPSFPQMWDLKKLHHPPTSTAGKS
jgi:hypothetical protein